MATIEGPTRPGKRTRPWCTSVVDLAAYGYEELELVVSGEVEGRGEYDPTVARAPFRTRMLVRRPVDPTAFSGLVAVEWLNVTGGGDIDILWPAVAEELLRSGWGYVGVSVMPSGVRNLRAWDPERYGALEHPGQPPDEEPVILREETYSDAIVTEVGELVRSDSDALFGGRVTALVLYGQSGAAGRLSRYLLRDEAAVYDGFLAHSGGASRTAEGGGLERVSIRPPAGRRVFHVDSQHEAAQIALQEVPDTEDYRYWQVAGSAHTPPSAMTSLVARAGRTWAGPVELGPPTIEYALRAAIRHLGAWIVDGVVPPVAPLISLEAIPADEQVPYAVDVPGVGRVERPPATQRVVLDAVGNAVGGVRLPHVEAPLGRHLTRNGKDGLVPGYEPFDQATLDRLYPKAGDQEAAAAAAADRAVAAGWLLPEDTIDFADD